MKNPVRKQSLFTYPWLLPGGFAMLKILVHLPFLTRYGYHHDELYFLDCGRHLSFGYVDHAPFIALVARLADTLFGQSLLGLRIFPVIAGAAAIFITGLLVLRLGGGRFGVFIACFSMLLAPVFVRSNIMLTIPAFEPLIWVACAYLIVKIIQENNPKLWLWIGLLIGIGLMIKHSTLLLVFGLGVGTLLTPLRVHLKTRWPYLGGIIALLIFLPNILWQIENGWPTVEFLRYLNQGTMSGISVLQFIGGQILYLNPFTVPIWIGGLIFFFSKSGKTCRTLGWIYISLFILLIIIKSKIYYLGPAYPAILAGGGVAIEKFLLHRHWERAKLLVAGTLSSGLLIFAPILLPIFSIETIESYTKNLTFGAFQNVYEITGDLHGQFAWKERVKIIADVYNTLSPQEHDSTIIFGTWYGIAGAINYFGGEYGLPEAVSGHMTYYLWGLPPKPIRTVVIANVSSEKDLKKICNDVVLAAQVTLENVNPWEREFKIAICREQKTDLHESWPDFKNWR